MQVRGMAGPGGRGGMQNGPMGNMGGLSGFGSRWRGLTSRTWIPTELRWTGNDATWRIRRRVLPTGSTGDDGSNDDDASEHGANGRDDAADGSGECCQRGWASIVADIARRRKWRKHNLLVPHPNLSQRKSHMEQNWANTPSLWSHPSDLRRQAQFQTNQHRNRYVAIQSAAQTRDAHTLTPALLPTRRRAWSCRTKFAPKEKHARIPSVLKAMSAQQPFTVSFPP